MEWKAQRKSETKVEDKGESEEATAEIEADGRRKEIADDITASTEKSRPFLLSAKRYPIIFIRYFCFTVLHLSLVGVIIETIIS